MLFQQIILHMVDRLKEERTISAPFHLIRGKRSGQTIQDVKSYHLTKFFALFPRLTKQSYDQIIQQMIHSGWLRVNENSVPQITEIGKNIVKKMPDLHLNGWLYRGNERIFFQRLSLVTQTLSHVKAKDLSFAPLQKDEKIQKWVRQFLHDVSYKKEGFIERYYQELVFAFQSSKLTDLHVTILSHRLSGYQVSGVTWQQLSHVLEIDQMELEIIFQESLHIILDEISINNKLVLLPVMSEGIKTTTPLTDSAKKTADFYKKGYSFEQITSMRQLKTSTIEDHFVEMAMNDPLFSIHMFFPDEDIELTIQQIKNHQTKKLRTLKEVFPTYSYFQLRLLLAVGGDLVDQQQST
ncbi:helix-turn-helix domain-containing protein [Paenisporosarcina macmurdoensis]|uniref:Helix-turn-helix domain-containing protein n=1 Tax=Paenisporosarcina macmurdoensis TaxID=212659 RepID=A0ABW1L3C0_9BACL